MTSTFEHDGGVLSVVQEVPARAWDAGLTVEERRSQLELARREFRRLSAALERHPNWGRWRARGQAEYRWLLERSIEDGGQWRSLVAANVSVPGMRERAAQTFRNVIDGVYQREYPVLLEGVFTPVAPGCPFIEPRVDAWRELAIAVLNELGEPLDEWHQAATLGLLLNPQLAAASVAFGFWLLPAAKGQTDRERQAGTMVGAHDTTERAAIKAKRDARRELGYRAPREKPGPKPGSVRRADDSRRKLEAYLVERSLLKLRAKQIAADAHAQLLYRSWRGDPHARLTEAIVRAWLRKPRGSSSPEA